jgi:hypothetical protein
MVTGDIPAGKPEKSRHASAVVIHQHSLGTAFGPPCHVRTQLPFALDPDSQPEADLAVVNGSRPDDVDNHPSSASLRVDVTPTTLTEDRQPKRPL